MFGYAQSADLIGKPIFDLLAPSDRARIAAYIELRENGGEAPSIYTALALRRDGSEFVMEAHISTCLLEGRTITIAILRDITERKRAEEQLREFQMAVNSATDAIGMSTPEGRHFYQNDAFTQLFGMSPVEVDGLSGPPSTVFVDENVGRTVFETIMKGGTFDGEVEMFDKKRSVKDIHLRAYPIKDREGMVRGLVGVHTDVSERKRTEKRLLQISKAVESSSNAIGISDAEGHHFYQNRALSELFEYATAEELEAAGGGSAVVRDPAVAKEMYENIMQGKPWVGELAMVTKSGRVFDAFERADTIKDENGKLIGLVGVITDIDGRKRSEAALRRSEEYLRLAVANGGIGLWEWDLPTGTLDWSDRLKEIFGFPVGTTGLTFKQFTDAIHPEDREETTRQVMAALGQDTEFRHEYRIILPDGAIRWIEAIGRGVRDDSGQVTRMMGSAMDITERKRAEQALLRVTERLELAQDSAGVGVWDWNVVTGDIEWTPRMFDLFGLDPSRETPSFRSWRRMLHPDDLKSAEAKIMQALQDRTALFSEYRIVRTDGEIRWINAVGKGLYGDDGSPLRMVGICVDITARKIAEEGLSRAKEFSDTLIQTASVMIVGLDVAGQITIFNEAAERITGFHKTELAGKSWFEALVPNNRFPKVWDEFSRLTENGIPDVFENPILTRAGEERLISWRNNVVREDGHVSGTISFGIDITEQRRTEEQLRQAQKMESIGNLAGGVAHDFNNKLAVIVGSVDLIMEETDPASAVYSELKEIRKAADASAELTRQLLAFARRQAIAPRLLDLNSTVGSLIRMLRRLIGENIGLAWIPGPGDLNVLMDPGQIDRLLANLCVNARDAIDGIGEIVISTEAVAVDKAFCTEHPEAVPGQFVMLRVSDNGRGMNEETRRRIFEPFFTTKGVGEGTGLGLATVYGIVAQNHGFINVSSEPGRGSTFRIYLPRREDTAVNESSTSHTSRPDRGSETILLVEDESANLLIYRRMLERLGYRVLTAASPKDAFEHAAKYAGTIDLVISDVIMPQMNGRDLVERLHRNYPSLRALYMSGHSAEIIGRQGVLDAGLYFIQKPFTLSTFAAKVREALDRRP